MQDLCLSWILNSVVSWKGCFRFSVSVWCPWWTVQVLLFLKGVSVSDLIGGLHFVIFNLSTVLCPRTLPQEPLAEVIFSPFLLHYFGVRCRTELRWAKLRCHSSWLFCVYVQMKRCEKHPDVHVNFLFKVIFTFLGILHKCGSSVPNLKLNKVGLFCLIVMKRECLLQKSY